MSILNVISNIFKNPHYLGTAIRKALSKSTHHLDSSEQSNESHLWCEKMTEDYEALVTNLDRDLWKESKEFYQAFEIVAKEKLKNIGVKLGGGGNYPLLYFIVRRLNPEIVLETGVAAGFSTKALLQAINKNDNGFLYSNDFPYLKLKNPEDYIGVLVDDHLKDKWKLYLGDDKVNLKKIASKISKIDLFHYDSNKSYEGRKFAMETLSPLFTKSTVIVMDDIQDNLFFRDYVVKHALSFKVFKFEGKYMGVIGL